MTLEEKIERFEQLLRVLYEVRDQEKAFDLTDWRVVEDAECGTAACAIGHAAQDTWFVTRNFYLRQLTSYIDVGYGHTVEDPVKKFEPMYARDGYYTHAWEAVEDFFDISDVYSSYLFGASEYEYELEKCVEAVIDRVTTFTKDLQRNLVRGEN